MKVAVAAIFFCVVQGFRWKTLCTSKERNRCNFDILRWWLWLRSGETLERGTPGFAQFQAGDGGCCLEREEQHNFCDFTVVLVAASRGEIRGERFLSFHGGHCGCFVGRDL